MGVAKDTKPGPEEVMDENKQNWGSWNVFKGGRFWFDVPYYDKGQ
ncbi:hypothetical protein FACS189491_05030 [Spirochaetia bacterium]|nr:hypothetical protein FACS189491_05030 [Spirochaetia bacterium]